MKIVIAPDSFKESLSAPDVAEAIARGWRRVFPRAHLHSALHRLLAAVQADVRLQLA
ncbi:glycerate kinase, partial [Pseudomonas aeruginosa]|uniref:glycerate kinase n=1 Tax=Pseudomonas aeruginosa TaxID=287 RepID=UPI003F6D8CD1